MNDSRLPALLYVLMLLLGVLQWVHAYPQLPAIMASHFAANGTPNGWEPKQAFFLLTSVIISMTAIASFVVPRWIASLPASLINLPHKPYWLAPERREETLRFLRAQMAWFGCGLLFLLLNAISQAINANLPGMRHFDSRGMLYVLGGFVLFSLAWTAHFLRHFYNVPK
jgi:uncharacterized membrane protein